MLLSALFCFVSASTPDGGSDEIGSLKSGKLISSGVTGGVAVAIQAPVAFAQLSEGKTQVLTASAIAMPYVSLLPAYWQSDEELNTYCAGSWTGEDQSAILKRVRAVAVRKAESIIELIKLLEFPVGLEADPKQLVAFFKGHFGVSGWGQGSFDDESALLALIVVTRRDTAKWEKTEAKIQETIANWFWDPTSPASCWGRRFGVFVGLPSSSFPVSFVEGEADGSRTATREFRPTLSFGVVFTPNAYVSALIGLCVGNILVGETPMTKGAAAGAWTLVAGIGGNLDLLGFLLPK